MSKTLRARAEVDFASTLFGGAEFFRSRIAVGDLAADVRRVAGNVNGPQFVLVHGIGASSRYFQPLAVELANHGTVWLIDLSGYGSAPKPHRTVTIREHAEVVAGVLEQCAIAEPVLVGHSMGCQVVTELAAINPELSDRVVLIAPTINPAERSFAWASFRLAQDIAREPFRANLAVGTDYFFRCGPAYFVRQLPQLLGDRIEERLPGIAARTLVIVGDRDPVVPRAWADEVARLLPNAQLAVVNGPHVVMFTDAPHVARLISEHSA